MMAHPIKREVDQLAEVMTDDPEFAFLLWRYRRLVAVWARLAGRMVDNQHHLTIRER